MQQMKQEFSSSIAKYENSIYDINNKVKTREENYKLNKCQG